MLKQKKEEAQSNEKKKRKTIHLRKVYLTRKTIENQRNEMKPHIAWRASERERNKKRKHRKYSAHDFYLFFYINFAVSCYSETSNFVQTVILNVFSSFVLSVSNHKKSVFDNNARGKEFRINFSEFQFQCLKWCWICIMNAYVSNFSLTDFGNLHLAERTDSDT